MHFLKQQIRSPTPIQLRSCTTFISWTRSCPNLRAVACWHSVHGQSLNQMQIIIIIETFSASARHPNALSDRCLVNTSIFGAIVRDIVDRVMPGHPVLPGADKYYGFLVSYVILNIIIL